MSDYVSFKDIFQRHRPSSSSINLAPGKDDAGSSNSAGSPSNQTEQQKTSLMDWGIKGLSRLVKSVINLKENTYSKSIKPVESTEGNNEDVIKVEEKGPVEGANVNPILNLSQSAFFVKKAAFDGDIVNGQVEDSFDQPKNLSTRSSSSSDTAFRKSRLFPATVPSNNNRISLIGLDLQADLAVSDSHLVLSFDDNNAGDDMAESNAKARRMTDSGGSLKILAKHRRSQSASIGFGSNNFGRSANDHDDDDEGGLSSSLDNVKESSSPRKRSFNLNVVQSFRRMLGEDTASKLREYWMNDQKCKECYECKLPFTTFRRRHHCRICGQIFCGNCASTMIEGFKFGYANQSLIRVCNYCNQLLVEYNNSQSGNASVSLPRSASSLALQGDGTPTTFLSHILGSVPIIGSSLVGQNEEPSSNNNMEIQPNPVESMFYYSANNTSDESFQQSPGTESIDSIIKDSNESFSYATNGVGALKNERIRALSRASSYGNNGSGPVNRDLKSATRKRNRFRPTRAKKASRNPTPTGDARLSPVPNSKSRLTPPVSSRMNYEIVSPVSSSPASADGDFSPFPKTWKEARKVDRSRESSPNFVPHHRRNLSAQSKFQLNVPALEHMQRILKKLLNTAFPGNNNEIDSEAWKSAISTLVIDACGHVTPNVREGDSLDIRTYVKVKKISGDHARSSKCHRGLIFSKNVSHKNMPKSLNYPRILLLAFPIEYERIENQYHSIDPIITQEHDYLRIMVSRIMSLQPNVVVVEKSVSRLAVEMFEKEGIALLRNVKSSIMDHLSRCTRAEIVQSIDRLVLEPRPILGTCETFSASVMANDASQSTRFKSLVYFEGCRPGSFCTLVVRGGDIGCLSHIKKILKTMMFVVYNLKLETRYLRDIHSIPFSQDPEDGSTSSSSKLEQVKELEEIEAVISTPAFSFSGDKSDSCLFERALKSYEQEILSVSPNVKFPLPYLLNQMTMQFRQSKYTDFFAWFDSVSDRLGIEVRTGIWSLLDNQQLLTPLNFQKLMISLSSHLTGEADNRVCQAPEIYKIDFYMEKTDVTLGQFLEDLCTEADIPCAESRSNSNSGGGCDGRLGYQHFKSIVHGDGRINIHTNRVEDMDEACLDDVNVSLLDEDVISMWSRCRICNLSTHIIQMTEESWSYSFGKFLELYFHYPELLCRNVKSDACQRHRIHRDHDRYFAYRRWIITFSYEKISIFELILPSPTLVMSDACISFLKQSEFNEVYDRVSAYYGRLLERISQFPMESVVPADRQSVCQLALNDMQTRIKSQQKSLIQALQSILIDSSCTVLSFNNIRRLFLTDYAPVWETSWSSLMKRYSVNSDAGTISSVLSGGYGLSPSSMVASAASKFSKMMVMNGNKESIAGPQTNRNVVGQLLDLFNESEPREAESVDERQTLPSLCDSPVKTGDYSLLDGDVDTNANRDRDSFAALPDPALAVVTSSAERDLGLNIQLDVTSPITLMEQPGKSFPVLDFGSAVRFSTNLTSSNSNSTYATENLSNPSNIVVSNSPLAAGQLLLDRPMSIMKSITNLLSGQPSNSTSSAPTNDDMLVYANEHLVPDSQVLIREDEPSSLIAFTLLRDEYLQEINNDRDNSQQDNNRVEPLADLERSIKSGSSNHIKMDQFEVIRKQMRCEATFPVSLFRCSVWKTSGGKSGSIFFKSKDDRYVLKQMSKAEMDAFMKFAPFYFDYIAQTLFHALPSVLSQILGVYRLSIKNAAGKMIKYDMMVTVNLFFERKISRIFDLKGSVRNRHVHKESQVLQDENLYEFMYKYPLFIREHSKKILRASIWNDTLFLSKLDVMDYSLIVGVDEEKKELVIGIVDFIRTFTWDKKLESWVKESGILGGGGKEPTIVSPKQYKNRFRDAMDRYFLLVPDPWTHLIESGGDGENVSGRVVGAAGLNSGGGSHQNTNTVSVAAAAGVGVKGFEGKGAPDSEILDFEEGVGIKASDSDISNARSLRSKKQREGQ